MVKLIIRGHPRDQMLSRGVSESDIQNALASHYQTIESSVRNSIQYLGRSQGRELKVWLLPPGLVPGVDTVTVKTVAWRDA